MKIESHLQPNCSESSWRITGPKGELKKIEKALISRNFDVVKWIDNTLLAQTTEQHAAGEYYQTVLQYNARVKVYEDLDNARDCTCGGSWCPEEKWKDLTNSELLASGKIKQVKLKK